MEVHRLGQVAYSDALRVMEQRVEARREGRVGDTLFLLEHSPVFTLGRRAQRTNILASEEVLNENNISVIETGRGGDVTYHGPGQIVAYPVLSLAPDRKDVKRYVADLEEVMINVCSSYGIAATRLPGQIGCWVEGRRKIGAIGVRISRWITSHGFAFNVSPNMSHFSFIIPCGIADKPVTTLAAELGYAPSMEEVVDRVESEFYALFGHRRE